MGSKGTSLQLAGQLPVLRKKISSSMRSPVQYCIELLIKASSCGVHQAYYHQHSHNKYGSRRFQSTALGLAREI